MRASGGPPCPVLGLTTPKASVFPGFSVHFLPDAAFRPSGQFETFSLQVQISSFSHVLGRRRHQEVPLVSFWVSRRQNVSRFSVFLRVSVCFLLDGIFRHSGQFKTFPLKVEISCFFTRLSTLPSSGGPACPVLGVTAPKYFGIFGFSVYFLPDAIFRPSGQFETFSLEVEVFRFFTRPSTLSPRGGPACSVWGVTAPRYFGIFCLFSSRRDIQTLWAV